MQKNTDINQANNKDKTFYKGMYGINVPSPRNNKPKNRLT